MECHQLDVWHRVCRRFVQDKIRDFWAAQKMGSEYGSQSALRISSPVIEGICNQSLCCEDKGKQPACIARKDKAK